MTSITTGADGLGLISYYDFTNEDLKVAHCDNTFCSPFVPGIYEPTATPTPIPTPLVFVGYIEQGQTKIELISEQEQLLEVPTDQFDVVSATFKQPRTSVPFLDFGVRLGMPWSDTEIEIKIRYESWDTKLIVTRRHPQIGFIYWEQIFNVEYSADHKIEFQEESGELAVMVNGAKYPIDSPAIDFDVETFKNVTLFVNSENKVINVAESPYFSVTNFYVHNNGNVLIP
jgi:hypothetical protein